jgi:peptidoglycan/xylan/chitin deacetylase (PgdA/CDA1 family)
MNQGFRAILDRRTLLALSVGTLAAACGRKMSSGAEGQALPPSPVRRSAPTRPSPARHNQPGSGHPPTGPAREVTHGSRRGNQVALTFHTAGDPAVVDAVLAAARHANARLTMLVVGTWLEANPGFARRIVDAGHDIGNHTWSHPVLPADDSAMTREEIRRCKALLTRLTGSGGAWFRPSGTPHATPLILRAAGAAGYPVSLSYDLDPLDYTDPGSAAVTERVLAGVRPGSIISLHTLYPGTATALPAIFAGLHRRGLQPVTTRQLLGTVVAA